MQVSHKRRNLRDFHVLQIDREIVRCLLQILATIYRRRITSLRNMSRWGGTHDTQLVGVTAQSPFHLPKLRSSHPRVFHDTVATVTVAINTKNKLAGGTYLSAVTAVEPRAISAEDVNPRTGRVVDFFFTAPRHVQIMADVAGSCEGYEASSDC